MASFTINNLVTVQQTLSGGDTGVIGTSGVLSNNAGDAVGVVSGSNNMIIGGAIYGAFDDAISGENLDQPGDFEVVITSTGQIAALDDGVVGSWDGFRMTNNGEIVADFFAINLAGHFSGNANSVFIQNAGDIIGSQGAITTLFNTGGGLDLFNSGLIDGGADFGVRVLNNMSGTLSRIENSGTIVGASFSLELGEQSTVRNTGTLDGDVRLSNADDVLNSRFGTILGDVFGQDGDDMLKGGDGGNFIDGGNDNDTLYGFGGDDTLDGGAGFDTLIGNMGDDSLNGGGKADRLIGGKGNDTMSGGGSSDTFVFRRVANGDDEITDFQNGSDLIDLSALGIQNFNALKNTFNALSNDTDAVVIDLAAAGGSGSVRVVGVQVADMDAGDFIF